MFPPWNHNNTTAEFALILMVCPMKYLSGGTTHRGALILKTMKTKVPPPSLFQLWGPEEKCLWGYYAGCASGEQSSGNCKVYLVAWHCWIGCYMSMGREERWFIRLWVRERERKKERQRERERERERPGSSNWCNQFFCICFSGIQQDFGWLTWKNPLSHTKTQAGH